MIGFLRRICKLLYHGILPVFVFDGATPEIKLRELNARRKRKLQWLGGVDDDGEQTAKKMARKLLVSQLRQSKELDLSRSLARGDTKQRSKSGIALAPGFMTEDELNDEHLSTQNNKNRVYTEVESMATDRVSFRCFGGREEKASISEFTSFSPGRRTNSSSTMSEVEEEELVLFPEENGQANLDIEALTALPPKLRKDMIETAKRELKIKSRKEFMSVASDPIEYSNVQLKSFLKTVSLNKQIHNAATPHQHQASMSGGSKSRNDKFKVSKADTLFSSFMTDDSKVGDGWSERSSRRNVPTQDSGQGLFTSHIDCEQDQVSLINNQIVLDSSQPIEEETFYYDVHECIDEFSRASRPEITYNASEQWDGGFIPVNEHETYGYDMGQGNVSVLRNESTKGSSIFRETDTVINLYESHAEIFDKKLLSQSHLPIRDPWNEEAINIEKMAGSMIVGKDDLENGTQFSKMHHSAQDKEVHSNHSTFAVPRTDCLNHPSKDQADERSESSLPFVASQAKSFTSTHDTVTPHMPGFSEDNSQTTSKSHPIFIESVDDSIENKKSNDVQASDISLYNNDDSDVEWVDGEKSYSTEEDASVFRGHLCSVSTTRHESKQDSQQVIVDLTSKDGFDKLHESLHILSSQKVENSYDDADICNPMKGTPDEELSSNEATEIKLLNNFTSRESSLPKHTAEDILLVQQQKSSPMAKTTAFTAVITSESIPFDLSLEGLQRQEWELRDEWNKYMRDTDYATDEHIDEVKQLIQLFGLPIIQAPAEAEAQCAAMEKMGLVDGVVTEDSDAFVFGAETVFKNIFDDKVFVEAYNSNELKKLGLSRNELVALAMLLGGDYTDGVKGVGIVNGMEILQAFSMEQSVLDGLSKFRQWLDGENVLFPPGSVQEKFHLKHLSARLRWSTPKTFPSPNVVHAYMNPVVDQSELNLAWDKPDLPSLKTFCKRKMGWTEGR